VHTKLHVSCSEVRSNSELRKEMNPLPHNRHRSVGLKSDRPWLPLVTRHYKEHVIYSAPSHCYYHSVEGQVTQEHT